MSKVFDFEFPAKLGVPEIIEAVKSRQVEWWVLGPQRRNWDESFVTFNFSGKKTVKATFNQVSIASLMRGVGPVDVGKILDCPTSTAGYAMHRLRERHNLAGTPIAEPVEVIEKPPFLWKTSDELPKIFCLHMHPVWRRNSHNLYCGLQPTRPGGLFCEAHLKQHKI